MGEWVQSQGSKKEEIYLSFPQTCGILDIDQALLYNAMKNVDLPKVPYEGRKKSIKVIPVSLIEKIKLITSSPKWRKLSRINQEKAIENLSLPPVDKIQKQETQTDAKIKEFAKRRFQHMT